MTDSVLFFLYAAAVNVIMIAVIAWYVRRKSQGTWEYRKMKYVEQGETLYKIVEYHPELELYGEASVSHWTTEDDLIGTLKLMKTAKHKPTLNEKDFV